MSETAGTTVDLAISANLAIVTLNRPKTLNAVDVELASALANAIEQVGNSKSARALLLRGAGRAFCAGGDVSKFDGAEPHAKIAGRTMERFHPAILKLASLPIPTLASVHGAVAGAGIGLMLACDFALAEVSTRFTLAYPKIGATIDGGASWFLTMMVGLRKAKELAMVSDSFDAETALSLGLINRISSANCIEQDAEQFARELAAGPTMALGTIKSLMHKSLGSELADQLENEHTAFVEVASSADFDEGLDAFLQKRKPKFEGR